MSDSAHAWIQAHFDVLPEWVRNELATEHARIAELEATLASYDSSRIVALEIERNAYKAEKQALIDEMVAMEDHHTAALQSQEGR